MTNSNSSDRTGQIESLLQQFIAASVADRQASNERMTRMEQLTESNSRAIQALADDLATFRLTTEQNIENARAEREELREATLRLQGVAEGIANLLVSLDSDRPTILRKLNIIENKVDQLLKRENGDQP